MLCKYVLHGKNTSVNNIFVHYLYNYVKLSNDASAFNLDSCKECFVNALLVHCCEYLIDQYFFLVFFCFCISYRYQNPFERQNSFDKDFFKCCSK